MDKKRIDGDFILDVLKCWTEFTKPENEDETVINLNSWDYTFRRYNEKISKLAETYSVPSEITIVYLKNLFGWYLEKASITLADLFNNNIDLSCIKKLFELFGSERVSEFENSFYDTLNYISAKMIKNNLIGKIDFSKIVENSLDIIFDELMKCRVDIYQRGGTVQKIGTVSQEIYVFNTLVECLSVLQNQQDAIYICYISNHNTSDGYFGFFIKNNGNIFSVNERVPEAFIGQHQNGRNHRFVEQKPDGIFPYELFDCSNYDYKGYAKTYTLKNKEDKKVLLADLNQNSYITLLMVILMMKFRFEDKTLDGDIVYSNFCLSSNVLSLQGSGKNELMLVSNNQLVKSGENKLNNLISKLTTENILSGELNEVFSHKVHPELRHSEYGYFGDSMFIDMYSDGFVFNPDRALIDDSIKLLSNEKAVINAEFVGNEKEMFLQVYQDARRQLANHIQAKMNKEYSLFKEEFGSASKWWESKINDNIERVRDFVIQSYVDAKNKNTFVWDGWRRSDSKISVHYNEDNYNYKNTLDFYNGKPCTCMIKISITDWEDIEEILGEKVPKIIMGYTERRESHGNSLLNVVDPVLELKTPFEMRGSFSYNFDRYEFPIRMYFSKSGLRKYIKDKGIVPRLTKDGEIDKDTIKPTF